MIPVITIDGPGGSGKGTVSKIVGDLCGFNLLDSGAIYRVLAYVADLKQVNLEDENALYDLGISLDLSFKPIEDGVATILDGQDISKAIRNEKIGGIASKIASLPKVRESLLEKQKQLRVAPGLVGDGRDLGTVVFPDAELKIFLDASAEERANRRVKQLQAKGQEAEYESILNAIKERDFRDRNRAVAPLVPANDAVVIDSTNLSIDEVVEIIISKAKEKGII